MKPIRRSSQQISRRAGALAASAPDGSVPLYPEVEGQRPTWDLLPADLRGWVDARLPVSGDLETSYAVRDGDDVVGWGILPRAIAVLVATKRATLSTELPWAARATVAREDQTRIKRATLPAVAPTFAEGDDGSPGPFARSVFTNLPSITQRAIDQATVAPSAEYGSAFFTTEELAGSMTVTQELWYHRQRDDELFAGAYARRSMVIAETDYLAGMRVMAVSMQPWDIVAFRARVDWSFGASSQGELGSGGRKEIGGRARRHLRP